MATPPLFVDKVDKSLTDPGRVRSSTCRPSARRRRMLTESSLCHDSQRHSTSIDWSRFMQMVKMVKFSHTRYRALGPELLPVYRQSAHR